MQQFLQQLLCLCIFVTLIHTFPINILNKVQNRTETAISIEFDPKLTRTKRGYLLDKLGQVAHVSYHSMTGDPCSVRKFWLIYLEVSSTGGGGCDRCDKYFHCRANFDAVHTCMAQYPGDAVRLAARIRTAEQISNAREWGQKGKPDSEEDQRANRFGRSGGNCEQEYLENYGCFYDPWRKICRK